MLKRKLWRMSFFCQGAYLIVAVSNGGNLKHQTEPTINFPDNDSSVIAPKANSLKIQLNPRAAKFANAYLKENEEALEHVRERSKYCFRMMDSVFTRYELPVELKYLAVIESELKRDAVSHVGAVGPWQFMPSTARLLGLKITSKYDERKYYTKSTVAAAKYLRDLYCEFGDWLLVIAAYNGGPVPVYKAIKKSGSKNFWKLQAFLPAETRGHVKRFISTHYYFEGQGGVTTLTKSEMNHYLAQTNEINIEKSLKTDTNNTSTVPDSIAKKLIAEKIVKRHSNQKLSL